MNDITRELGKPVPHGNDPDAIGQAAGLDWKTVTVPAASRSPRTGEYTDLPGYIHLHRSDGKGSGHGYLGQATTRYKPVQNNEILGDFCRLANETGLNIVRAGELNGGQRVCAVAESAHTYDVGNVGDLVNLRLLLTSGHVPGIALETRAYAGRLVCTNGMIIGKRVARFRWIHKTDWNGSRFAITFEEAIKAFEKMMAQAEEMRQVPMDIVRSTNFISAVYQPDLWQPDKIKETAPEAVSLDAIADATDNKNVVASLIRTSTKVLPKEDNFNLNTRRTIQNLNSQPGSHEAGESLWNTLNAVVHHTDHVRGRSAEGAWFGNGVNVKEQALVLANQVASAV